VRVDRECRSSGFIAVVVLGVVHEFDRPALFAIEPNRKTFINNPVSVVSRQYAFRSELAMCQKLSPAIASAGSAWSCKRPARRLMRRRSRLDALFSFPFIPVSVGKRSL
jgi:hypothetical protein